MKLLVSLSRNISNVQEIEGELNEFVKEYIVDHRLTPLLALKVKKWVNSVVRNYLINEFPGIRLVSSKKSAPDWMKRAWERGETIYRVKIDSLFLINLEHAIGWLKTLPDRADFSRVSYADAVRKGNELIELENKRASEKEDIKGIEILHEWPDGYKMVNVVSAHSLKREGKLMQHCVGSEQQDYIRHVGEKKLEIWSLRDPDNGPHATIEYDIQTKTVKQIKGKQNAGVVSKYVPYLQKFFALPEFKKKVHNYDSGDLLACGILVQDGTWYDLYRLPEGFLVKGGLHLQDTEVDRLSDNLIIEGDLDIENGKFTKLPKNLVVEGCLYMRHSKITEISDITVNAINLSGSQVQKVGDNVSVTGEFVANSCYKLTTLPKAFKVGGNLILNDTAVSVLPNDMQVGGHLRIRGGLITKLPFGLKLKGNLDLDKSVTDISNLPKSAESVSITDEQLSTLPDDFTFKGELSVTGDANKQVKVGFPKRLKVIGDLILRDVHIGDVGLQVTGYLHIHGKSNINKVIHSIKFNHLTLDTETKNLPPNMVIPGDLNIAFMEIKTFPEGLTVKSNLVASGLRTDRIPPDLQVDGTALFTNASFDKSTEVPAGLKVGGLDVSESNISRLPPALYIAGNLDISDSRITSIPRGLHVAGNLTATALKLKKISPDLKVGGRLDLHNTQAVLPKGLTLKELLWSSFGKNSLPNNLTITGDFSSDEIDRLPEKLVVGGSLILSASPVEVIPNDLVVGQDLVLRSTSHLKNLPDNFHVPRNLDLSFSALTVLPKGLWVGGDLNVSSTKIAVIPPDLKVGGNILGFRRKKTP